MTTASIPFIEVSGEPRERGRQYGEAAREQIHRSIAFYRDAYARAAKLSWDQVREHAPRWVPLIDAYLPGILDEVHGIAEGADVTFEDILALNGRAELSVGNPFAEQKDDGCSSFAILEEASGDGHVYCGQNWDWRSAIADTVVVLRIVQPGKPTIVMHAEAGQVGRQGANSAGHWLERQWAGHPLRRTDGHPGHVYPPPHPGFAGHVRGARSRVLGAADVLHEPPADASRRLRHRPRDHSRAPRLDVSRPTACWCTPTTSSPTFQNRLPRRIDRFRSTRCTACRASSACSSAPTARRRPSRCAR